MLGHSNLVIVRRFIQLLKLIVLNLTVRLVQRIDGNCEEKGNRIKPMATPNIINNCKVLGIEGRYFGKAGSFVLYECHAITRSSYRNIESCLCHIF